MTNIVDVSYSPGGAAASPVLKSGYERAERMKWSRTSGLVRKRRRLLPGRGQKGFVLIELLVSIAIFGVISVGFLSALVAGYHGVIVAHDQTMAQSLTRTTLENVRRAAYPITDYQTTDIEVMRCLFMPTTSTRTMRFRPTPRRSR